MTLESAKKDGVGITADLRLSSSTCGGALATVCAIISLRALAGGT